MKRTLPLIIFLVLILASCSAQAEPTQAVPPPAEIENTQAPPPTSPPATSEPTVTTPTSASSSLSGAVTFNIIPEESKVSYEVGETFFNQNNRFNLAIGVTQVITGSVFADLDNPPASSIGPIEVDISQFTSDSNRRDNAIRGRWLESTQFPIATFVSTQIVGLPDAYVEGQDYLLKVTGDLTVRDVTRSVTFDVTARLEGDTLSGRAETTILLSDYNIGPIDIAGMLKTEDVAHLILEFTARP